MEHNRGDIWARRAEQFPGLIININKPKIYYQLTAEFAQASVLLLHSLPKNCLLSLSKVDLHLFPLVFPLFIACGANKSLWLILIASDVQPRHHFFRLILNLVLYSLYFPSCSHRLPSLLLCHRSPSPPSSQPHPLAHSLTRRQVALLWLICKQASTRNLANNLTWLKCCLMPHAPRSSLYVHIWTLILILIHVKGWLGQHSRTRQKGKK